MASHSSNDAIQASWSGSGGFYKYRCKFFNSHHCANWCYVKTSPCASCLVSLVQDSCSRFPSSWLKPDKCSHHVGAPARLWAGWNPCGSVQRNTDTISEPQAATGSMPSSVTASELHEIEGRPRHGWMDYSTQPDTHGSCSHMEWKCITSMPRA